MIIIVMGVSGSGKTTIGQMLAASLGWEFQDADAFHSPANIEKMRHGIPLTDADRIPWLQAMQNAILGWLQANKNAVLACSALKASYRQYLLLDKEQVKLVYLKGNFELIQKRLQQRPHHYMPPELLQSQCETLEEPKDAVVMDISDSPEAIVEKLIQLL